MSGFMIGSSPPDQESLSKPARIPPPWCRSKSVVGHGRGRPVDRFQKFAPGPELLSDVGNQKAGLPMLDHLAASAEIHCDDGHTGGIRFDQDQSESLWNGIQVQESSGSSKQFVLAILL